MFSKWVCAKWEIFSFIDFFQTFLSNIVWLALSSFLESLYLFFFYLFKSAIDKRQWNDFSHHQNKTRKKTNGQRLTKRIKKKRSSNQQIHCPKRNIWTSAYQCMGDVWCINGLIKFLAKCKWNNKMNWIECGQGDQRKSQSIPKNFKQ